MGVNRAKPHLMALPEDDANRQLANGFSLALDPTVAGRFRVLPVAGGWREVLRRFDLDQRKDMQAWPNRFMILLMDFDGRLERLDEAKRAIPQALVDRVFVLGVLTNPEELRMAQGPLEGIGRRMAADCPAGGGIWDHPLLQHNAPELDRMRAGICQHLLA
jgi:hypothetical protein